MGSAWTELFSTCQRIGLELDGIGNDSDAYLSAAVCHLGSAACGVAGDNGRAKQKVACSCQVGSTGIVVQDLCTIRTQPSRRGCSGLWFARLAVFVAHGFLVL